VVLLLLVVVAAAAGAATADNDSGCVWGLRYPQSSLAPPHLRAAIFLKMMHRAGREKAMSCEPLLATAAEATTKQNR